MINVQTRKLNTVEKQDNIEIERYYFYGTTTIFVD